MQLHKTMRLAGFSLSAAALALITAEGPAAAHDGTSSPDLRGRVTSVTSGDFVVQRYDGTTETVDVPLTSIKPCLAVVPGGLAVISSTAAKPPTVLSVDLTSGAGTQASPAVSSASVQATVGERRQLPFGDRLQFLLHRPD